MGHSRVPSVADTPMRLNSLVILALACACQRGAEPESSAPPASLSAPESGEVAAVEAPAEEGAKERGGGNEGDGGDEEARRGEDGGELEAPGGLGEPRPGTYRIAEVRAALGMEQTVVGEAADAKLSAVVLIEESPVYCLGQDRWPEGVVGEQVEVTGVVRRTDRFQAKVAGDGAISQGTKGGDLVIEPCAYHLMTLD